MSMSLSKRISITVAAIDSRYMNNRAGALSHKGENGRYASSIAELVTAVIIIVTGTLNRSIFLYSKGNLITVPAVVSSA